MVEAATDVVLVVDDDQANRYVVAHTLRRAGYDVREVGNGRDALRLAAERPALVILDIKLPDIDGLEVCRRLKLDPATASIPVLHLSANLVQSGDKARGLEAGADGYLVRPVEPPELIATVRSLIRVREAERIARLLAGQWQATFDAISDGLALLDREGNILRCNRALCELIGGAGASPVGRRFSDLVAVGDLPTDGEPADLHLADRWFRLGIDRLPDDEAGEETGAVCILTDITERKRLEDELRRRAEALAEADRRKDEYLAMLAHELRNPLSPALHSLELLRRDPVGPEAQQARAVAERQILHMARLVDDLLDVSRFSKGKIGLREERVDLREVVERAVDSTRPHFQSKQHELAVELPPGPLPLEADPARLEQVLANLLNNAAKYTDPGGRVTLAVDRRGDEFEIRVRDTGVGLTAEMLPRVFDLFAQEERSLARTQGGLGIGLTLVRTLVELHGGSVEARSEGPGRGSEFVVRLPSAPAEPPGAGVAAPVVDETRRPDPRRILVVDDHVDAARILARVLGTDGHEVRVEHDGLAAVEAARELGPEVVMLDIGLPRLDGYEVARRLRALAAEPPPLLIALTGYGQEEDRRLAREAGFDHHLVKPVDLAALRGLLSGLDRAARPATH